VLILNAEAYSSDPFSPLRSPILFPTGHKNLPPTYFQICGMDPLRDEGLIYERVLREECGVKTLLHLYPGLPHAFWSRYSDAKFTKDLIEDSKKGMQWLLEQSKPN
jgi:acetyl esterase/lipase